MINALSTGRISHGRPLRNAARTPTRTGSRAAGSGPSRPGTGRARPGSAGRAADRQNVVGLHADAEGFVVAVSAGPVQGSRPWRGLQVGGAPGGSLPPRQVYVSTLRSAQSLPSR